MCLLMAARLAIGIASSEVLSVKKMHQDPVTGDIMTTGEWVSWKIQGVIRRWIFLGIVTALTAYVWVADPIWRHPLTDQWNLSASYLAIAIESVTAMAIINQARRDAVVLREIRDQARRDAAVLREIRALSQEVKRLTQQIEGEEAQEVAELVKIEKRLEGEK